MNYKTKKKFLNRNNDPWPSGFEITVYDVPRAQRATVMGLVFNKFENVVRIIFA